jgi:hypothetical protein
MNLRTVGIVAVGAGLVILFAGSEIAGVGQSIDNLVASKWTGAALLIGGVALFAGVTKKAAAL